jgi:hypothetical protein
MRRRNCCKISVLLQNFMNRLLPLQIFMDSLCRCCKFSWTNLERTRDFSKGNFDREGDLCLRESR